MSYVQALEAAGAVVHDFAQFGDYQGEWYAYVTYKGETGWANGSYGSCSGCDAFEAEFGYHDDKCHEHRWERDVGECDSCAKAKAEYDDRLADFGRSYLDGLLNQEQVEAHAGRYIEWDSDAVEAVAFVKGKANG